ncbi:MAG: DUF1684 domain-containing protein [Anaerolineales bacterium]
MIPKDLQTHRAQKNAFLKSHPQSPWPKAARSDFAGLDYFPYNPELDLTLKAERFAEPESVTLTTNTGEIRDYERWGQVHFQVDGHAVSLTLYWARDHFFLPFTDATSGAQTYGAGRYLDPEQTRDDIFRIDFNRAYAPFCAYSEAYSCPLPPAENRLSVAIRAGEKTAPKPGAP